MKLNQLILLLSFSAVFAACSGNKPKTEEATTTPAAETPQIVGNDSDEHGCKASAGYTWSALKNECIRLFEAGIRLDPQEAIKDKTLSAFIVFKSEDDDAKAEVFMPGESAPRMFVKQANAGDGDAGTWKGGDLTISYWRGMYMLEDANKKVLYQGMWDNK